VHHCLLTQLLQSGFLGVAVIIFAFITTGIYTKRANGEFDDLANKIKKSVKED